MKKGGLLKKRQTLKQGSGGLNKNRSKLKSKPRSEEQKLQDKEQRDRDWEFYLSIWTEREHRSEASGTWLGDEPKTVFFDHLLDKGIERYKHLRYEKDNIMLLTWEEHSNKDTNPHPEHVKRINQAKKRFNV